MTGTPDPDAPDPDAPDHGGPRRPLHLLAHRLRQARHRWERSSAERMRRHAAELELLHRSMGFAALGLVTLIPLLIVVAAVAPYEHRGFATWMVDGMGLHGRPADAVSDLFSAPRKVVSTTSAFSVLALALFALTFGNSVQTGYEKVWHLPAGQWHSVWRRAVWLAALTGYLFAEAQSGAVLGPGPAQRAARAAMTLVAGILFFWWGQRFLLGSRVPWAALLPGAVAAMLGLVGLRFFSFLVFSPLIVSSAVTYGPVGTVLIVQSWLIGVGYVVFGGALLGRYVYEAYAGDPRLPRRAERGPRAHRPPR